MEQLNQLNELRTVYKAMGGADAVAKQKAQKKLTARERIELVFDKGSFLEFGMLADHSPNNRELEGRVTPGDGVVTGTGLIEGRPVVVISYDFTVLAGTMGEISERKTKRMREVAMKERIPLVWLLDSAGARIQEAAGAQFAGTGDLFLEQVSLSGQVPMVAAVVGPTAAGTSYIAALADYTPMRRGISSMALAGPPLVKAAVGEDITTEELGGSKVHCEKSGVGDGEFDSDEDLILNIRKYLSFFPSHCRQHPPVSRKIAGLKVEIDDSILTVLPDSVRKAYDMRKVVEKICDFGLNWKEGGFLEVQPDFARNIITGFGRIMGHPIAIVANQPSQMGGAIDNDASDKAARFLMRANAFNIPVLFLHDCPGFLVGSRAEHAGIIRHGAKFLHVVASLTVPKFSVVIRKSYGAGYYVMCGKGLDPDLIVGWPTAEISLMGAEGAANIVMKNKDAAGGAGAVEAKAEKVKEFKAKIGGLQSARLALIDDIIDPRETRAVLMRALQFTSNKRPQRNRRKHGIMPV